MSSKIRHTSAEGDWTCPDVKCANLNFARRNNCNRCGKEKEMSDANKKKQGIEIGKAAAEKSHGLFSADDWQCTKCGNVNWARRSTCNMCNAPKVGELEERTGYGGGFNERIGVEYVKRDEDSDDEFDAFGRRKKKFKGNTSSTTIQPPPVEKPKSNVIEEEDEEDDDDDEDGDLSKYDIWGADDEEEEETSKTEDTNQRKSPTSPAATGLKKSGSSRSPTASSLTSNSPSHSSRSWSRDSSSSPRSPSDNKGSHSRGKRSRSREGRRNGRSNGSNSSYSSESRSRSRSRSYSKDKKQSRK